MPPRAFALVALTLAGCSGPSVRRTLDDREDLVPVRAVAVYAFGFRWDEPPHRAYGRAIQQVDEVLTSGRFLVLGPEEFTVYRPEDDDVFSATTLVGAMNERGIKPGEFAVLRGWAEKRVLTAVKQLTDAAGRPIGGVRDDQVTVVAHLDVIHPAQRRVLGSFESAEEVDLFREPDTDPLPELTRAIRAVTRDALEALGGRLVGAATLPIPFQYAWNPRPALEWKGEAARSTAEAQGSLDVLDRDVARRAVFAEFDPEGDGAHGRAYDRNPQGLWVTDAGEVEGLATGDLVIEANGKAVVGPHVLHREINRGEKVELGVMRGRDRIEVTLPALAGRDE